MIKNFKNHCIVVTGAAGGIGFEIVKEISALGAKVLASDYEAALKARKSWPKGVLQIAADLTKEKEVERLAVQAVDEKITGIIHCAGFGGPFVKISETTLDNWDKVFAVNIRSMFILLQNSLDHFVKQKFGKIIAISSVQSLLASSGSAAYVSSKHALNGLLKTLAAEYSDKGIRANLICPGYIQSPMGANDKKLNDYTKKVLQRTPSKKMGDAGEIARLCIFLLDPQNDYINGSVLTVDGGLSADLGVL